ncbi:formate dehydrogenase accessory sulfurtransferase FdhD [Arsenicicoccus dermatophilus]|uniref:formate dehydrogenase accessory sulfurtransferase FdhD n=1 Tax=Arsenicicoccus dermatophilus TaxID=1076331 RepID=UPI001F4C5445|nr:formate dehydrogenase accessory sulfurtransferase FdhD [Arsenicicoccus dermatophilus]MCH8612753.1 formate dehydrogenase accessory sulfurtransferase FdhD [Arsenicicoccus dermatophilus]
MGRVTTRVPATRYVVDDGAASARPRPDTLAVEEPLEVRVAGEVVAVTMRTPGDDFDLALGFLLTEGVVACADDVLGMMHCLDEGEDGSPTYNVVDVTLRPGAGSAQALASATRSTYTTSSCGVCGKAGIDAIRTRLPHDVAADPVRVDPAVLVTLPDRLREHQAAFERTGGVHAAGIFTPDGRPLLVREDVGRHNAVDKVIGAAARAGLLPLSGHVLQVSGRASFELTQKAAMAGLPVLSAVSAPSSLAVGLARDVGLTLVAFVRAPRLTAYSREDRLGTAAS